MTLNGFCPTCIKLVYFDEDPESDPYCPVCSGPLVAHQKRSAPTN